MDYLAQILMNPSQERTITVKTKPIKDTPPEAPLSPDSANLPPAVLQMMGLAGGGGAAPEPDMNAMLAQLLGQGGGDMMPIEGPTVDPLGGQVPIDGPMPMDMPMPMPNPYGG